MSNDTFRIAIVGGGIGGLALAMALEKTESSTSTRPLIVTVYERDAGVTTRSQGFQIGLHPDGLKALRDCGSHDPAFLEDLRKLFTRETVRGVTLVNQNFKPFITYGPKPAQCTKELKDQTLDDHMAFGGTVDRWDLRSLLCDRLLQNREGDGRRSGIVYNHKFTHYVQNPDKTVTVHFSDMPSVTCDLLVGADGASSRIRAQRCPTLKREQVGVLNIGGEIAFSSLTQSDLERVKSCLYTSNVPYPKLVRVFGTKNGVSMLLLPQLSRSGQQQHLIWALTWPAPNNDSVSFLESKNLGKGSTLTHEQKGRVAIELCERALEASGIHETALALVRSTSAEMMFTDFATDLHSITPIPRPFDAVKSDSRVTILGDALHCMTSHRGLGGNTAIQDALDLARAIRGGVEGGEGELEARLEKTQGEMCERGFGNVRASLSSTRMNVVTGWSRWARDALFNVVGPCMLKKDNVKFRYMYDWMPVTELKAFNELQGLAFNASYAGLLPVSATASDFFWYFTSPLPSTQLVVWLNGGPGCSSLFGSFIENGPAKINDDGTITVNTNSWSNHANFLYVEQPVGTGFSYDVTGAIAGGEDDVARQFYAFLDKFYATFPETRAWELYIMGESYAGVYMRINLKGLAIGNGVIDGPVQFDIRTYASYLSNSGFLRPFGKAASNSMCDLSYFANDLIRSNMSDPRDCFDVYNIDDSCSVMQQREKNLAVFLNTPDVRSALHVTVEGTRPWIECTDDVYSSIMAGDSALLPTID
ncbi:hypothetical protein HK101_000284, partial [Irineochytrium annulatum]